MEKILFIGASGMLGKPVAWELIKSGFEITLLGRDSEKLAKLFPNIRTLKGDVYNQESLVAAMKDQDFVYSNLSIDQSSGKSDIQTEKEGIKNIIYAAKETGIKRLGYISSLIKNYRGINGFNWWAFDIKHAAVDAIKHAGIPYSIFYPSTFMETIDQQMIQGNRILLAGKSEAPMWFIAAKDFGMQVAWALKKAGNNNQEYSVQGPDPYTFDEAAKIFIDNYKRKLSIFRSPLVPLKLIGLMNNKINYSANICEALNKYPEKFESEKTWNDLGKPMISLTEYVSSLNVSE